MNLVNHYWYFQSVIPQRICDDIVKYGKQLKDQMAVTGGYDHKKINQKQITDLKKKRNSNIVWMSDQWIYNEIRPYINGANNNAGWNFQWDWSEACQFTKYEKGQYYDWHCDSWDKPYFNQNNPQDPTNGKIRKLSVTVSLSDPKDYKGGELEFDFRNLDPDKKPNIKKCQEVLPKGSLVVFPSHVWHRVCPVKKGSRYSLVIWNLGWPFK
jgi:PKHD-type hydroxylase